jgi:hypothetical protein
MTRARGVRTARRMLSTTPRNEQRKRTHVVLFECGHTTIFDNPAPLAGEELYCVKCRGYKIVTRADSEYRIICQNCRYSRSFGRSPYGSALAVSRHLNRYPSHAVELWDGLKLDHVFEERTAQLPITDSDEPPF